MYVKICKEFRIIKYKIEPKVNFSPKLPIRENKKKIEKLTTPQINIAFRSFLNKYIGKVILKFCM